MKCPECKAEINRVLVYSQCMQIATLKGDRLFEYETGIDILDTQAIECPECNHDLRGNVLE